MRVNLKAEYIVDIATLTGAIVNALGSELGGVFGDEELSFVMKKVGDQNGDYRLADAIGRSIRQVVGKRLRRYEQYQLIELRRLYHSRPIPTPLRT